ncbi:MAG: hypothetical protein P4K93_07605 [Terracidiphilus sp.]|nr:hypothetical protein [Terracidiphilus sp.]
MTLTKEQQEAVQALNDAIVEQIAAIAMQRAGDLRKVGLKFSEFEMDLLIVHCEEPASKPQSDAEFLNSLHIASDLTVADPGSEHQERP